MRCVLLQRYVSATGWSAIFRSSDAKCVAGISMRCGLQLHSPKHEAHAAHQTIKTDILFYNQQLIIKAMKRMLACTLL